MNNSTITIDGSECEEHPPLSLISLIHLKLNRDKKLSKNFKMVLVGVIGTIIAIIGFLENTLVFYTFVSSRALRNKNLLYLTCLSACDIFICFSYVEIMSVQIYAEYFHYFPLFRLWHNYLRVAFAISHIAICTISFLIMAAAIERYLQNGTSRKCEGFASMGVKISELAHNVYYDGIWRFWTRRIATVFLPFFVLLYCNAAIVVNLRRNNRESTIKMLVLYCIFGISVASCKLRNRVKAATRALIMVVTCYLFSNIIDVFIAAWEYLDAASLSQLEEFYSIATDVSSLLTILAASLRFPIYLINDKIILREVRFTVCFFYYHLAVCFSILSKRSRRKHHLKGELKERFSIQRETITHNRTDNTPIRKTRNSLGAVFISVTGIGLDQQRLRNSIVALEMSPSQIAVRIPFTNEEQSSTEINDNQETVLLLSSNPLCNQTEKDTTSISE
uniref:G_PROTEIN_RECEP_F1_2 domain-containing protein n=1 Tax=Elaeophora elaphi TaxID=1147741 RepID=A0A0R3RWH7_9BILA